MFCHFKSYHNRRNGFWVLLCSQLTNAWHDKQKISIETIEDEHHLKLKKTIQKYAGVFIFWVWLATSKWNVFKDHPYITSANGLGGRGQKNVNFCWRLVLFMLADDVIYGWSHGFELKHRQLGLVFILEWIILFPQIFFSQEKLRQKKLSNLVKL